MTLFTLIVILFAGYFGSAYFYLMHLTRKYLSPIDRSEYLHDKLKLKTATQLKEKYADYEYINFLVLTGGGVRGMVPLYVLEKLEELTGKKTGELFDFMAGTSTGAINCAILSIPDENGGFKYKASDIEREYIENIRTMFKAPWYHKVLTLWGLLGPRYLPEGKLQILSKYLEDYTLADINMNFLVPVYDLIENSLVVVRNWEPLSSSAHPNYLLRDLIHGASNPPMLFSPRGFLVKGKRKVFIDPGVIINNPAEIALINALFMFPNKKIRLVVIGNGGSDAEHYGHEHMADFGAYGLFQYLLNSPIVSSKFSIELVREYIEEAKNYGINVDFVFINSKGGHELATSDTRNQNMHKIINFANKMCQENKITIEELAWELKR